MTIGEINRFFHIYWNAEYASKVNNDVAYKIMIASKVTMILIVSFVAFCDPSILMCNRHQLYVCNRKTTALHRISSMGLSFLVMISVSIYFVRKVYTLAKVHPHSAIEEPGRNQRVTTSRNEHHSTENENSIGEIAVSVRRLNQNPNQFFKVKILKAAAPSPSRNEAYPIRSMVKKALIVNLVTLCQFAFLFPISLIDILVLIDSRFCEDDYFTHVLRLFGFFGIFGYISFPLCLEKKLDKFCQH